MGLFGALNTLIIFLAKAREENSFKNNTHNMGSVGFLVSKTTD